MAAGASCSTSFLSSAVIKINSELQLTGSLMSGSEHLLPHSRIANDKAWLGRTSTLALSHTRTLTLSP